MYEEERKKKHQCKRETKPNSVLKIMVSEGGGVGGIFSDAS